MSRMLGAQTIALDKPVWVSSHASIVGKKEGEGPFGAQFDRVELDDTFAQPNWEKAESAMSLRAMQLCLQKGECKPDDVRMVLGGDLLNQLSATHFACRSLGIPLLGLFGACSTMAESLAVGAMLVDGGAADRVLCATSSHFATAERQFRTPLELGTQRAQSAQWTVTGAGAVLLEHHAPKDAVQISHVTVGKPVDFGVTDAANMGAAMAPAAADTLLQHFEDMGITPDAYDLIATGDLGHVGSAIFHHLLSDAGCKIPEGRHVDCGALIFSKEQDAHAGGSGCGCSASMLSAVLLPRLENGDIKRLLFVATGALMSTTSANEGESIPSIAHAVAFEKGGSPCRTSFGR